MGLSDAHAPPADNRMIIAKEATAHIVFSLFISVPLP
jgi:hypothetical protein